MKPTQANTDAQAQIAYVTQSAKDQKIYEQIFEAILGRRLLPGTKLSEANLANIFNVSRTVVRRALLRLSSDGIVDIQLNRGARIAKPTVKQAREVFAARRTIEREVVREAVEQMTGEALSSLRKLVEEEQLLCQPAQRGRGIRFSGDFHIRLAQISQNTTLTRFIKTLVPQTSLIIALYEQPNHNACSPQEHEHLLDIIANGDVKQARIIMDAHLRDIENSLVLTDDKPQVDLGQIFSNAELE